VETTDERDVLRELACDFMQGFLFAQASPAEDVTRLLSMANGHSRALSRTA
jgi:EAL domain-containing protein (putative c-di-GMP-specific phosphodiesterase class I)